MEFVIAKSGGFCRGVKKAVDTALTIDAKNTYIFGEIIHLCTSFLRGSPLNLRQKVWGEYLWVRPRR